MVSLAVVTVLGVIMGVLSAYLYPTGRALYSIYQVGNNLGDVGTDGWKVLDDPVLKGCGAAAIYQPTGQVFLACSESLPGSYKWFPPFSRVHEQSAGNKDANIVVLDMKTSKPTLQNTKLHSPPPFSISVTPHPTNSSSLILMTLTSQRTIEIFSHTLTTTQFVHLETIPWDEIGLTRPGGIAAVGEKSFYVTDQALIGTNGRVVFRGEDGTTRVATEGLTYPTDIAASSTSIYVVDPSGPHVLIYERKQNNRLRLLETIEVPIWGEQISVDPESGAVYVSGIMDVVKAGRALLNKEQGTPFAVMKVVNNTAQDRYYGKKFKSKVVFADTSLSMYTHAAVGVHPSSSRSFISGNGVRVIDKVL
ncbi:uncharacterized protein SPPG_05599 [Spizellomyces punctatus DAOM BR117]|uniref:SMP-30/Gluconolactonase/LRE-like region domain-containing protein n=1 Tax=Spizellomyces punctatus (strain DAOM BR117) TaxID=645134 RepID=A0A0L0HE18_SPIPD|nr:uncharacterized protein SPPG_05599 [Spizellomyces punctatus DAOM BR117]KNC99352.1 hypothetical protein SPPG_05599 [Spizellomyces punctatus DAOM BR117]|eukprot:XP_016607392.1 hypothetical protein SPPG_05599 [Spizellomyces punctatus DAOM BR117]